MKKLSISTFKNRRDNKPKFGLVTWESFIERVKNPEVRAQQDGAAFAPCSFEPLLRCNKNVTEISMLVFDIDNGKELEELCQKMQSLNVAYSIYSTHSHQRVIEKNPNGDSRFRVCIPLLSNIPPDDYRKLWLIVNEQLDLRADEQAKDVSRMYYKPVKSSDDALYDFYNEEHLDFFDWQTYLEENEESQSQLKSLDNVSSFDENSSQFASHKERHLEFCRRIERAATLNSRGRYEMRCPVHNGKTETSLVYFPDSKAVKCLNQCDYFDILRAFGLPDHRYQQTENIFRVKRSNSNIICLADVVPEEVSWLWFPFMPKGKLTMISGEEGLGKSWLTCVLASIVSTGRGFPFDVDRFELGTVLMLSAEDGLADTIKPRLISCGADSTKVFALNEKIVFNDEGFKKFEEHISEIEPALVTVDPIFAYTSAKTDVNSANQSRSISAALAAIAERYGCAIVLIRHIGKSKGFGDARAAGLGSIDWRAASRSELLVGRNPDDEQERAIIQTKNNLAPFGAAIGFTIDNSSGEAEFIWTGRSSMTAEMILSTPTSNGKRNDRSEPMDFLREILSNDLVPSKVVEEAAAMFGFTTPQLRGAKSKLGVKSKKMGGNFGGDPGWYWYIPNTEDAKKKEN